VNVWSHTDRWGKTFRCIAMDPPWNETGGGKIKRGADRHYPTMSKGAILRAILESRFDENGFRPDPTGCHLWTWATMMSLARAMWLIEQLGFQYVTHAVWVKGSERGVHYVPTQNARPVFSLDGFGLGQYLRGQHELLILARIGETIRRGQGQSVIVAPRGRHSEKPSAAYEMIETVSNGPRPETFARAKRDGWAVWGNEV